MRFANSLRCSAEFAASVRIDQNRLPARIALAKRPSLRRWSFRCRHVLIQAKHGHNYQDDARQNEDKKIAVELRRRTEHGYTSRADAQRSFYRQLVSKLLLPFTFISCESHTSRDPQRMHGKRARLYQLIDPNIRPALPARVQRLCPCPTNRDPRIIFRDDAAIESHIGELGSSVS